VVNQRGIFPLINFSDIMAVKRMAWIPALLVIIGMGIIVSSAAGASPQLPCEFYGTVMVSGAPAPVGTVITAHVNNTEQGSITVNQSGIFGGTGTFDERLIVPAGENDFANGIPLITFRVNGQQADQTAPFRPGTSTEMNLTVGGAPAPVSEPVTQMNVSGQDAAVQPASNQTCVISQVESASSVQTGNETPVA
jgi:hypothetical protein